MKKILKTVAVLVAIVATSLHVNAQTTSSEGNAANPAQSKNGSVKDQTSDGGKSRAEVSREVSGARPDSNKLSNKFGRSSSQASREARTPSRSDGKVSVKEKAKASPKTKKERSKGRSFGDTGSEN